MLVTFNHSLLGAVEINFPGACTGSRPIVQFTNKKLERALVRVLKKGAKKCTINKDNSILIPSK